MKLGYHPLSENYGFYLDKTPQNVLNELKAQIDELQSDFSKGKKYNASLAGEIEHEYGISPQPHLKHYIQDLTQQFENESQYMFSNYYPIPTLKFNELWVNFQKKYEYNPIHNHTGIYSFVIWYQIPFTFENELNYHYSSGELDKCNHGHFTFVIPRLSSHRNTISEIPLSIDKSKEGYIALFPSTLNHQVYPFYSSDEYRITIASNIRVV